MSRLITIIILLTALWSRAYCTEGYKVVGRVVESDGTPVSGAVIKLKVGQGDEAKMGDGTITAQPHKSQRLYGLFRF